MRDQRYAIWWSRKTPDGGQVEDLTRIRACGPRPGRGGEWLRGAAILCVASDPELQPGADIK